MSGEGSPRRPPEVSAVEGVARLIFEMGHLRRVERAGWALAKVLPSESVSSHTSRTALIAYLLAILEGGPPHLCALLAVLHDLPETRTGDQHHLAQRYLEHGKSLDRRVLEEQIAELPAHVLGVVREDLEVLLDPDAHPSRITKDADILDSIAFVRESLVAQPDLQSRWIAYLKERLSTDSAIALAEALESGDPNQWWLRAMGKD